MLTIITPYMALTVFALNGQGIDENPYVLGCYGFVSRVHGT